jgi:hypothetical protein
VKLKFSVLRHTIKGLIATDRALDRLYARHRERHPGPIDWASKAGARLSLASSRLHADWGARNGFGPATRHHLLALAMLEKRPYRSVELRARVAPDARWIAAILREHGVSPAQAQVWLAEPPTDAMVERDRAARAAWAARRAERRRVPGAA